MPDLPKLEDLDATASSGNSSAAAASDRVTPATPPQSEAPNREAGAAIAVTAPSRDFSRFGPLIMNLILIVILAGMMLYGMAGILRVAGLYDVRQWWTTPPASPSLADLPGTPGVAAPAAPQALPPPAPVGGSTGPLRDQPPRSPPSNLPQFTIRDGEQHDFLTDLDAETLKRLAEVQGQLDSLVTQMANINQAVQALARNAVQQRQQEAAHQSRVQADLTAVRQEIAAVQTVVGEVEARLKRARGGLGAIAFAPSGAAAAGGSGQPVAGWSVKAVSGDRAWLRTPKGGEVTVVAGERLKVLGAVRAVDAIRGIVVLDDGRVVR